MERIGVKQVLGAPIQLATPPLFPWRRWSLASATVAVMDMAAEGRPPREMLIRTPAKPAKAVAAVAAPVDAARHAVTFIFPRRGSSTRQL
ncbi:MAG: hypothetical protein R2911_40480 [Caldilineaceae bacterium]